MMQDDFELEHSEFVDSDDVRPADYSPATAWGMFARSSIEQVHHPSTSAKQDALVIEDVLPLEEENESDRYAIGPPLNIPGPGIFEAMVWAAGVLPAQIFAGIAMTVILLVAHIAASGHAIAATEAQEFLTSQQAVLTGGGLCIFVLMAIVASVLRLGPKQVRQKLALTPLPLLRVFAIAAVVLPLSMIVGQIHAVVSPMWNAIVDNFEVLRFLNQMEQMQFLEPMARELSLPILLMIIAVSPAVGEELVFRGVIGRGLIARTGLIPGILVTSFLFALLHLHPPVVVALIPLAIFIHLLYFTTRSFLAPVLLHFLNNSWAAVVTKYAGDFDLQILKDDVPTPPLLLASAIVCVVVCGWWFWQTRASYQNRNGRIWNPGYLTVEEPPAAANAVRVWRQASAWANVLFAIAILQFFVVLARVLSQSAASV